MSIQNTLKQVARIGVIAMALSSSLPEARAQNGNGSAGNTASTTQRIDHQNWTWGTDRVSQQAKKSYEKLPDEYKIFENKTFEERTEIAEEWSQRDFIKRSQQKNNFLKQHPNARVKDFYPQATGVISEAPLAKYQLASSSWLSKIAADQKSGYLSDNQALIARELLLYGRPLATVDPQLPYAQKLQLCGFDVLSRVAAGERKSALTPRDLSIYIAQLDVARDFNEMPENIAQRNLLRARLDQEADQDTEANLGIWDRLFFPKTERIQLPKEETRIVSVNGHKVLAEKPNEIDYHYDREVAYKIAQKIADEDNANQATPNHGMEM